MYTNISKLQQKQTDMLQNVMHRIYNMLYSVTSKPGKYTFVNIENLWVYYSNRKVFPGEVFLPTMHGKICCL